MAFFESYEIHGEGFSCKPVALFQMEWDGASYVSAIVEFGSCVGAL